MTWILRLLSSLPDPILGNNRSEKVVNKSRTLHDILAPFLSSQHQAREGVNDLRTRHTIIPWVLIPVLHFGSYLERKVEAWARV